MCRTHQSLVWDRTRHLLRLRLALRDFVPAALAAFADLDAPDALELLWRAPISTGQRLTKSRIRGAPFDGRTAATWRPRLRN